MADEKKRASDDVESSARARFEKVVEPDVAFDEFVKFERQEISRQQSLAAGATQPYLRGLPTMTPCGGGDFESGIDPNEWQGAFGKLPLTGADPFVGFTGGLFPASINAADANGGLGHQTAVTGPGTDPIVGIPLTAQGSAGAVRIGNAVNNFGCDLLSKTFTVPAARKIVKFWYAVVLQNPPNHQNQQPFFWVRVTETATGTPIVGVVDLGNGSDTLVADATNPFFTTQNGTPAGYAPPDPTVITYKAWSCAQINLSAHVGKQVTVEFITADCGAGGHWGYAYVDNFCGDCAGSPTGNLNFDAAASSGCGEGKLCFDYSLPTVMGPAGPITGTIEIKLEILQNGAVVATLASPVLSSGTSYCFDIDPGAIAGLDPALEGFDFVATGDFKLGTTHLASMSVGGLPDGLVPGPNNDYKIACKAFSYAVKFVCGTQAECNCACTPVRPGSYSTEINIYNHGDEPADITKYVIPVVFGGAAAGREPRTVTARAEDRITLPPQAATMDDCCRLSELLLGAPAEGPAPLSIGFLEIVSPVELTVIAVYTASGPGGGPVSIDVQQIEARSRRAPPAHGAGPGKVAGHH
jgi:hypothetical protein